MAKSSKVTWKGSSLKFFQDSIDHIWTIGPKLLIALFEIRIWTFIWTHKCPPNLQGNENVITRMAWALIQTSQGFSWTIWEAFWFIVASNDAIDLFVFTIRWTSFACFIRVSQTTKRFGSDCRNRTVEIGIWVRGTLTGFHCGSHSSLISLAATSFVVDPADDPIKIKAGDNFMIM